MLRQYFEMKSRVPDAILFYRMGDFYEMFFEDAREAAPLSLFGRVFAFGTCTRTKNFFRRNDCPRG
jgi:hypothetical protein